MATTILVTASQSEKKLANGKVKVRKYMTVTGGKPDAIATIEANAKAAHKALMADVAKFIEAHPKKAENAALLAELSNAYTKELADTIGGAWVARITNWGATQLDRPDLAATSTTDAVPLTAEFVTAFYGK